MKIVKAGYEVIKGLPLTKKIERIARICYKSEDRICEGSDIRMINNLIKRNHLAMLEHGSLAFIVDKFTYDSMKTVTNVFEMFCANENPLMGQPRKYYLRFTTHIDFQYDTKRYIVSGNMRAWFELFQSSLDCCELPQELCEAVIGLSNGILNTFIGKLNYLDSDKSYIKFITDFSELSTEERMVHEDLSVLFVVDRGVANELVRHREASFAQESTRYINYSLGRFGNEITVVNPCFWYETGHVCLYEEWIAQCTSAEKSYFKLLKLGATPQQARDVLPISTKTDIAVTANLREWHHILNLRACDATGPAHPQIREVMVPLLRELQNNGYAFAFNDLQIPN